MNLKDTIQWESCNGDLYCIVGEYAISSTISIVAESLSKRHFVMYMFSAYGKWDGSMIMAAMFDMEEE